MMRFSALRRGLPIRWMSTAARTHKVLIATGDGVGREIVPAARQAIDATGVKIEWKEIDFGLDAYHRCGHFITEEILQEFEKTKVLFKGPLTIPQGASAYVNIRGRRFTSANQVLRKVYSLYANIRPSKSVPGVKTPFSNVDLVTYRENTEDLYTGEEKFTTPERDVVEGIKRISRVASERVARSAYEYAIKNNRHRVTIVHKANVCKLADGLWLQSCRDIAKHYPQIRTDDQLADSLLTRMVQAPHEFDVLLCPNLFGDLVSDLAAGLIGSLGLCGSGQFGADGYAVFEPCHGSAPDIAGKGLVNPVSQLRSGVMMLQHLGEHDAASRLEKAIVAALSKPQLLTKDLGGKATTQQLTDAIIAGLK